MIYQYCYLIEHITILALHNNRYKSYAFLDNELYDASIKLFSVRFCSLLIKEVLGIKRFFIKILIIENNSLFILVFALFYVSHCH